MNKACLFSTILSCLVAGTACAQSVTIAHEEATPQAAYAARKLGEALTEQAYEVSPEQAGSEYLVNLAVNRDRLQPEAFSIVPEGKVITINGGDEGGMVYGALALAEKLRNGTPLDGIEATVQSPHLEFRGIKFNLPWDTYRPSSVLDQHFETVRDLNYWEAFLDMMVENRSNVISLWNLHPYTYMIQPENFPEASPRSEEEFAEWQDLYREILRMAK